MFEFSSFLTVLFLSLGDDNNGYNIPVIRSCPEVGDFLCQSEEEISTADLSQCSELVHRLLSDSYMCLYQRTDNHPQLHQWAETFLTSLDYCVLLYLLCHCIMRVDTWRILIVLVIYNGRLFVYKMAPSCTLRQFIRQRYAFINNQQYNLI